MSNIKYGHGLPGCYSNMLLLFFRCFWGMVCLVAIVTHCFVIFQVFLGDGVSGRDVHVRLYVDIADPQVL